MRPPRSASLFETFASIVPFQQLTERIVVSDYPAILRASDLDDTDGHNVRFGIDFERRLAREASWPRGQVCPAVRVASDSAISNALEPGSGLSGSWENSASG